LSIKQVIHMMKNHLRISLHEKRIRSFLKRGQKPWSKGYSEYRERFIRGILDDQDLLSLFRMKSQLPVHYGYRLDERVVEYPWILTHLDMRDTVLLDAGSALNFQDILSLDILMKKKIVIYTLAPEDVISRETLSYIYGDLRYTILRSEIFDEIACISTLEHIGMNNTLLYTKNIRYEEGEIDDYLLAIKEFRRLLKPEGKLLITVPYGRYENHGWLQQFDEKMIDKTVDGFAGSRSQVTYYRYYPDGWQIAEKVDCAHCSYYDIHHRSDYDPDHSAAARAVACIEMTK
jgi:hypothetical protein